MPSWSTSRTTLTPARPWSRWPLSPVSASTTSRGNSGGQRGSRRISTSSPAASSGPSSSCKELATYPWRRSPHAPASRTRASSAITSSGSSVSRRGSSGRPQESPNRRNSRQETARVISLSFFNEQRESAWSPKAEAPAPAVDMPKHTIKRKGESSVNEPKLIGSTGVARPRGALSRREERSRGRIGILSFSSPGHYYPLTALGRRLQSRGHEVVYFQVADLERPIREAGLEFRQIGREDFPLGALRARDEEVCKLKGLAALRAGIGGIERKARMLFRDAPAAIRDEGVDSLIVDQIEMAGGTVA